MRITTTLMMMALLLVSCNSVKRSQKFLSSGNYEQAIYLSVKKLQKGKSSPKNDAHIQMLQEAYERVVEDDKRRISFLEKEDKSSNSKEIYFRYLDLDERQNLIRPLLPIRTSFGKEVRFKLEDYQGALIRSKAAYVTHLYEEADDYLNRNTTLDARTAYNIYCEIDLLQPNYRDVNQQKNNSKLLGTDYVHVTLNNDSFQIIPARLERELLDFNTYNLDDFWTEYHNRKENGVNYNFGIQLNFKEIGVSPERINETEFRREKRIKDGWEYKLDRNGNVAKDSLGNDIKIDKYITVKARVMYTTQTKNVIVGGDVYYRNLEQNRDMDRHPLASEFIFENEFAKFRGDERALTNDDLEYLNYDFIPFPSNEQMVLDAGEDIKARLADILKRNSLR